MKHIESSPIDKKKFAEDLAQKYAPEFLNRQSGSGVALKQRLLNESDSSLHKDGRAYEIIRKEFSDTIRFLGIEPHVLLSDLCEDFRVPAHRMSRLTEAVARFIRGSGRCGVSEKIRQAKHTLSTVLFLPDLKSIARRKNDKRTIAGQNQLSPAASLSSSSRSKTICGNDDVDNVDDDNINIDYGRNSNITSSGYTTPAFTPPTVKSIIHGFGLDMRSHGDMLRKARKRARQYIKNPNGTEFYEPRKRRADYTSETIENHAIKFYMDVSKKIRGESKKGRFRMNISVKDAHAKWLALVKLNEANGGLGLGQEDKGKKFQRSLTWFRKLRPKEVLPPSSREIITKNCSRLKNNSKVSVKNNSRGETRSTRNTSLELEVNRSSSGAAVVAAVASAEPLAPVAPMLPPPKWL